jgi:hypothetical protein
MRTYEGTHSNQRRTVKVSKSNADHRIQQLQLKLEGIKPVQLNFDGEDVSANGGTLLLAQVEQMTGLLKGAAQRLRDHRTQSLIDHSLFEQIAQRVLQIAAGYASTDDALFLRNDPAIKMAVGRNPQSDAALSSQPTLSRFENNRTWKELYLLCVWLVDYYIKCHPKRPKCLELDFDGSAIETHGLQLQAFYRSGPYGQYMYFPLFVFDQHGWLLVAALRPGDHGEVKLSLPVLKRLVKRFRQAWPGIQITVRADGAFTDASLYKWMDDNNVSYVLGMKHNNVLRTKTKEAKAAARKKFIRRYGYPLFEGKQGQKLKLETIKYIRNIFDPKERQEAHRCMSSRVVRVCADLNYAAGSWGSERRVIARIDYTDEGPDIRYVVTNMTKFSAQQVYEDIYCKRARIELWIKNIKETDCKRLSCSQFKANTFRLLLHAFAYVLLHQVRMRLPEHLQRMNVTQLRDRFIRVACHVVEKRDEVSVRISASYGDAREFRLASKRLRSQAA